MAESEDNRLSCAGKSGNSDSPTVEDNLREIGELLNIAGANYERILKITKKVDANMMLLMKTQEVSMALAKSSFNRSGIDETQGNGNDESHDSGMG